MRTYYTEYPKGEFQAVNDQVALSMTKARVLYRENNDVTTDLNPFIILRDKHVEGDTYDPFQPGHVYTPGDPGL